MQAPYTHTLESVRQRIALDLKNCLWQIRIDLHLSILRCSKTLKSFGTPQSVLVQILNDIIQHVYLPLRHCNVRTPQQVMQWGNEEVF